MRLLEKLWDVSRGHAQRAEAPALVYAEPDLSLQMVRDDFRADVAELVIDDERQYHRILAYVRRTSPELAERVKLYKGKRPLFQRYEIEQGIRSTLSRRVPLPSGGSLVFDYGEAFTVVDVNTGRFTGTTKKLEDTILKNNLEAAVEVVRQLRLRDIGGIIVVDFIDMASQKNRDAVLEVLQRELEEGPQQGLRRRDLAARPGRDDAQERRRRRARDHDLRVPDLRGHRAACSPTSRSRSTCCATCAASRASPRARPSASSSRTAWRAR